MQYILFLLNFQKLIALHNHHWPMPKIAQRQVSSKIELWNQYSDIKEAKYDYIT
jgi:hypothetical protein